MPDPRFILKQSYFLGLFTGSSYLCGNKFESTMKKSLLITVIGYFLACGLYAQEFNDLFLNRTLRIDYTFSGTADKQYISVNELSCLPQWAGRRHHLAELPLEGNGQVEMKDLRTGNVIYKTSFSTLFQEWLTTDEAKSTSKAFENIYLLPYPKASVEVTINLNNSKGESVSTLKHTVNPDDVLIRRKGYGHVTPHKYLLKSGNNEDCIDVVILAEGYTQNEMDTFYQDARIACESLFAHEPFKALKDRFNIIAVESLSEDSGVSSPGKDSWKNTAFSSHFNTFYSDRYLTTGKVTDVHDVLAGIPYEHIIILANTEEYGGGGIYNAFTLTTAHHRSFRPVVVHEFGHSFAGLADEYFYEDDIFSDTYPFGIEPWEQNITTLTDFSSKWKDMLPKDTPVPTPSSLEQKYPVGVYEGGGYSSKGIYRPSVDCRMRTNEAKAFCPVCQRSIERIIKFYTNQ